MVAIAPKPPSRQRLGVPVHGAAFQPLRVPEETHHAMGLVTPQVSLNQRIGHDARGLAIHSKCLNAIRREATQGFMRNGPIHPGQSISCLVTLGSESPSPTVIQFDSTEAQVRHMRRSSNLDWLECPWGQDLGQPGHFSRGGAQRLAAVSVQQPAGHQSPAWTAGRVSTGPGRDLDIFDPGCVLWRFSRSAY